MSEPANAAEKLEEWRQAVNTAMADPDRPPFVASLPGLLVLGGRHWTELADGGCCWCQPRAVPHMGHIDWHHKTVMD